ELFGDEIDSMRTFNIESQRSIEKIEEFEIFPAKEIIIDEEALNRAKTKIIEELEYIKKDTQKLKSERIEKLQKNTDKNLENLTETLSFETIDSYLPYFYEKTQDLFSYLDGYTYILDDVKRCEGKLDSLYFEFNENYSAFLERGDILPNQVDVLIAKEDLVEKIKSKKIISLDTFATRNDLIKPLSIIGLKQITLNNYQGQLELLIEDIQDKKSRGYKTLILAGTRSRGERLAQTLRDREIESVYKDEVSSIEFGKIVITFGNLSNGFEYPDLKLSVISDKEVFGEAKRKVTKKAPKRKGVAKIKSFAELKPGDYVVHASNGVGVYKGIKQISVAGSTRDYLDIVYDKGDKLYVPVDQLDLVQKYIGSEGKSPKVS
ncbi:MAG: CarD family transcriptional regulator, partial [Clostridium sp.]